jgi:hypothetical protein
MREQDREKAAGQRVIEQVYLLIGRLERLSADSVYAHKASGLRGSLYRWLEQAERGEEDPGKIHDLVRKAYTILEKAAREIPDRDERGI